MYEIFTHLCSLTSSISNMVFWICLMIATWKYDVFGKLPDGLRKTVYTSLSLYAVPGLIAIIM